jgi:hypothetical protein
MNREFAVPFENVLVIRVRDKQATARLAAVWLGLASGYFWILPLFRPRGSYGWGHFRFVDIYAGVPLLVAFLCTAVYSIGLRHHRLALRLASILISSLLTLFVLDLVYAFGFQGSYRTPAATDFWFDTTVNRDNNLPDDELGFVRKPGAFWQGRLAPEGRFLSYRTDENGFRNASRLTQAEIVFIGDSFTEGASVPEEDTFVQQLGKEMKQSVVNLGRGQYGPQQELIILRRYGLGYHPRVVVWQLFEGNDLSDASRFAVWRKNPVQTESLAQRYFWHSLITHWLDRTLPEDPVTPRKLQDTNGTTGSVYLDYSYLPDGPAREPLGFAETKSVIEAGYRWCESRGVKLVVVFVPIKVRVLSPYLVFNGQQDKERYLPGGVTESEGDFAHQIAKFCRPIDCPFIDVTGARRAAEKDHFIYMSGEDSHLDVGGHRVVAETLRSWLQANLNYAVTDKQSEVTDGK